MRPTLLAALFASLALPLLAAERPGDLHDVRIDPFFVETVPVQPSRHRLCVRGDFALDGFKTLSGTQTVRGLYTRAEPSLEYRYAPGGAAEIFFRLPYTAQNVELNTGDGSRVSSRYSAGAGQPSVGFKLPLSRWAAVEGRTALPTEAKDRTPRLGDGAHYGADLLFKTGRWHWQAGHTVRLPYEIQRATQTFRRRPGGVTEIALARTPRDARTAKSDYVGTVVELHGVYADHERLDGEAVEDSTSLAGRAIFGFVLGKINLRATHLTQVAVSVGFGDGIHKTEDPVFGVGDLHLTVGYELLWGFH